MKMDYEDGINHHVETCPSCSYLEEHGHPETCAECDHPWHPAKMLVGIRVECAWCGRSKVPRGRSAPMFSETCSPWYCPGYEEGPQVGDLWPGESERAFGYPVRDAGTREGGGCQVDRGDVADERYKGGMVAIGPCPCEESETMTREQVEDAQNRHARDEDEAAYDKAMDDKLAAWKERER